MFNYRKSLSDVVHKSSKKKSLIFFCFALFLLINPIYLSAQDGKVSISVNNVTLKQFFDTIEKQSKYKFSYRDSALQGKDNISINAENKSLKDILNEILQARGLKYTTDGTNIVIIPSDAQETTKKEISGLVTDATGEPIIGANIIEKGTSNGTITDMNGYYSLEVNGNTLTISYIGYISQDISIGNKTNINVQLAEDTQKIDEVVVVGYGTQKKVNLTGSVETIKADVIENRPLRNATDALQGTIPGLTVTSTAGQPGNSSDFTVRGKSSINSGSALVLIDGMPGDINTINPLDIESISVLKDAASSAIYGARAAEETVGISVFFDEGMDEEQIRSIGSQIQSWSEVREARYISAEEAWESFKSEYFEGMEELAEGFEADNPLANSSSYEIYLKDISDQDMIVKRLEGMEGVRKVRYSSALVAGFTSAGKMIGALSAVIIGVLLAVAIFLISNTISVAAAFRRRENEIMRYIGATNFMIRAPFIVEGLLLGLFGAVIPLAGMTILYKRGLVYLNTNYQMITGLFELLPLKQIFPVMAGAAMALGVGIGAIVSFLTIQRHLRV